MRRLKVCCVSSVEEARLAVAHGADALGLVAEMPSGPGVLDDPTIAVVARAAPPAVATFLLTSRRDPDALIEHVRQTAPSTVQLVDEVPIEAYAALRAVHPALKIVQVVHVLDDDSVAFARERAPHVDALLLDSGNPRAAVRELGGTGRVHDWGTSRRIVEQVPCPVFLAGGLRQDNVAEAVRTVRPFGVDVCSGVRTDGRLDPAKLAALAAALRDAG